jgi:hypothetical protein
VLSGWFVMDVDKDVVPSLDGIFGVCTAAREGDLTTLKRLVNRGNVNEADQFRRTLLHISAFMGHTQCVSWLLDVARADVCAQDRYGMTALHTAASGGRESCILLLLKHGVPVDERDGLGHTPLYICMRFNHQSCAVMLLDFGASTQNVRLDRDLLRFPGWIEYAARAAVNCRHVCTLLLGFIRRSKSMRLLDKNVIIIMAKHIWTTRGDRRWAIGGVNSNMNEVVDVVFVNSVDCVIFDVCNTRISIS